MIKKYLALSFILLALAIPYSVPAVSYASWSPGDSLIPCTDNCAFGDLITLGANIVSALFYISIPLVSLVFAYAGYLYLTAMGNKSQVDQAKKIFTKVMLGFVIMLSAWLLVKFIQDHLIKDFPIPDSVKLK